MKNYWEKLKDPRWQKKRLEVLDDRGFQCEECGNKESTLHVHHPAYRKNAEPWDYEADELMCVCEDCHKILHYENDILNNVLTEIKLDINMRTNTLFIAGFLCAFQHDGPFDFEPYRDYEFISGVAFFFNKSPEELINYIKNGVIAGPEITGLHKNGTVISDFQDHCKKHRNKNSGINDE